MKVSLQAKTAAVGVQTPAPTPTTSAPQSNSSAVVLELAKKSAKHLSPKCWPVISVGQAESKKAYGSVCGSCQANNFW